MCQTLTPNAIEPAFQELMAVTGNGRLDAKTKALIGFGVASQIPCQYCISYHAQQAKRFGAGKAKINEALTAAALTR
jgi:AhpD family alkylhydroperoxidase